MMGAETFKDVREMSGGRFENCRLGRQAEGILGDWNAEVYDAPLILSAREDSYMPDAENNADKYYNMFTMEGFVPMNESLRNDFTGEKVVTENSENVRAELTEEEKQKYLQEILEPGTEFDFSEFDFKDKGLDRILNYFAESTWEGLSVEDKKSVITGYVGTLTEGLDINRKLRVDIRQLPKNYHGAYNDKNGAIIINSMLLDDPKELVNTISHEMRHAYQYERAGRCETLQDALYKLNMENYIYPVKDKNGNWYNYNEYANQLVEAEAEAFAEKITGMMEG